MWRELFVGALDAIRANRLRSLLTTLGITIGVFSMILLMALGEGTRSYMANTFASLGGNLLHVRPGRRDTQGAAPMPVSGVGHPLSLGDARALAQRLPTADGTSPVVEGTATVRWHGRRRDVSTLGVGASFVAVRNMGVRMGRMFTAEEENAQRRVVVIGPRVQEELFGRSNSLGQPLRINDAEFRVTGVLQAKGNLLGADLDDLVLIPAAAALDLFELTGLSALLVRPRAGVDPARVTQDVSRLLQRRHNQRLDFSITSQEALLATVNGTMAALTAVLVAIASIALGVGGIGIANIMLASVHERTQEIGLRRALGATRGHIRLQFLLEAATLSGLGGVMGLALGSATIAVAAALQPAFPIQLSGWIVATALGFSGAVGMLAGLAPALRAARMDPVEALRQG